jgi:hypothetical protein
VLNKNVTDILNRIKNVAENKILLTYPWTYAGTSDLVMGLDITKHDIDEFNEIAFYDLGKALGVFGLFNEERTVTETDSNIIIKSKYNQATVLKSHSSNIPNNNGELYFSKIEPAPDVAVFELNKDTMQRIIKAGAVYKGELDNVNFISQDDTLTIELDKRKRFNSSSDNYKTVVEADLKKEFNISIPLEKFNILPIDTYKIHIKYNEKMDDYRIIMYNQDTEGLKFLLSINE